MPGLDQTTSGPGTTNSVTQAPGLSATWTDNSGSALNKPDGTTVVLGGVASSITDSPGSSANNYAPTGYLGGTTNRLLVTASSGGTTLTGLSAATDGLILLFVNQSATDSVTFSHLSSSSSAANQFSCPGGVSAVLGPLASTLLFYIVNQWVVS